MGASDAADHMSTGTDVCAPSHKCYQKGAWPYMLGRNRSLWYSGWKQSEQACSRLKQTCLGCFDGTHGPTDNLLPFPRKKHVFTLQELSAVTKNKYCRRDF